MVENKFEQGVVHIIPSDLKILLSSDKKLLSSWNELTPLGRNEWICWIESAKKPETRVRRIQRTTSEIIEGKRRPCCWPGCPHRN